MGTEPEGKGNNNAASEKRYEKETWSEFIWNGKTGQFFGRTGKSWFYITLFYIIFYFFLAVFAWLCYYLFAIMSLSEGRPRWILEESIIGTNPGIGFRPMPDQETNSGSSLIWYRHDSDEDAAVWYNSLAAFTDTYENVTQDNNLEMCDYNNGKHATEEVACRMDLKKLGRACSKANKFGYRQGEPCIAIKLNKIFGWVPKPFGIDKSGKYDPDLLQKDLNNAEDLPDDLRHYIENKAKTSRNPDSDLNTIWISCDGENIGDQETIGALAYYPDRGIPGYYFPFWNQAGYQTPFIFVQLLKPKPATLINIECRAWAKNIIYEKQNRLGSVHFEMMID